MMLLVLVESLNMFRVVGSNKHDKTGLAGWGRGGTGGIKSAAQAGGRYEKEKRKKEKEGAGGCCVLC